jgi:hypothetical protein
LWRGTVQEKLAWIEFAAAPDEKGRLELEVGAEISGVRENDHPDARLLNFAVYGLELK